MPFQREHLQIVISRLSEKRKFIQCLAGPRQTGKTTLMKQFIETANAPYMFVSADETTADNTTWIDQQWESARLKLKQSGRDDLILIIDEIQKIKNWSQYVKANWDSDSFNNIPIKLVILGSSNPYLQKGLSESLGGRFEIIPVYHWTFNEMKEAFGYTEDQYAWFGAYPGAASLIQDEKRWRNYILNAIIETTVSKDILQMTRIDKPAILKLLLELGCLYSGQILSYNKIMGQLQDAGNTTTLSHYLTLLNTAGLLTGLEKYTMQQFRSKTSSPKFQVYNTALLSALSNGNFLATKANAKLWGRYVESALGMHLLNAARTHGMELTYWRERNLEVDFIVKHENKTIAIEVKSGINPRNKGVEVFRKKFEPAKTLLISNTGLTWQEFISFDLRDIF